MVKDSTESSLLNPKLCSACTPDGEIFAAAIRPPKSVIGVGKDAKMLEAFSWRDRIIINKIALYDS